jgi:hypothetical protein
LDKNRYIFTTFYHFQPFFTTSVEKMGAINIVNSLLTKGMKKEIGAISKTGQRIATAFQKRKRLVTEKATNRLLTECKFENGLKTIAG